VGADEPELKKVYRTGGSGYWGPLVLGLLALAIITFTIATGHIPRLWVQTPAQGHWASFALSVATVVIHAGLFGLAVYVMMQRRNACVALSQSGLIVTNWLNTKRIIPWEDIAGLRHARSYFVNGLWAEVKANSRSIRHALIAFAVWGESGDIQALADAIVSELALHIVPELDKAFHGNMQRVWRIPEESG